MRGITKHPELTFEFNPGGVDSLIPGWPLTNETVNVTFNAFIQACQNRIPMMRVKVSLVNESGGVESILTGIYARHKNLSVTLSHPMLGLKIPDTQKVFKKYYNLSWKVDAYRAWAFRKRLRQGIENVVARKSLTAPEPDGGWGSVSVTTGPGLVVGDGYNRVFYSQDFLIGVNEQVTPQQLSGTSTRQRKTNVILSVFDIPKINGMEICDASDLVDAYNANKEDTLSVLETVADFAFYSDQICSEKLDDVVFRGELTDVLEREDIEVKLSNVDVTKYGFENASEFYTSIKSSDDLEEVLSSDMPKPSTTEVLEAFNVEPAGCDTPKFTCVPDKYKIEYGSDASIHVNITVGYDCSLNIDMVNLTLTINTTCDVKQMANINWNYGELAGLDPAVLAACIYNWEECLMNPVTLEVNGKTGNYYEVALCGFGPANNFLAEDAKKLYNSKGLDSALGHIESKQPIPVYRSCKDGEHWVSHEIEKIGDDTPDSLAAELPAGRYACNASAASGYKGFHTVWKCESAPDGDENVEIATGVPLVKQVHQGTLVFDENGQGYVCEANTYKGESLFLPDVLPPVIHSPETAYNLTFDDVSRVWVITFKYPNVEDVYDNETSPTVGKSGVDIIRVCPTPNCDQVICEWKYQVDKDKVCKISLDRCTSETKEYYIVAWDKAGNKNYTALDIKVQADKDCKCSTSSDCATGSCVRSKCVESASVPKSASLIVTSNLDITVGVEKRLVVTIKNPNTFNELIDLKLNTSGCSKFVRAWFAGYEGTPYEKETSFTIPPGKITRIPVKVYTPVYDPTKPSCILKITATSWSTSQKQVADVTLNFKELVAEGAETQAPGIELVQLMAVMVMSTLILLLRRNA